MMKTQRVSPPRRPEALLQVLRWTVALTIPFFSHAANLAAQEGAAGVLPVIQPKLTRIIGSDTLGISQAALSPNARWVVFRSGYYLWVISSDGGEPRRLVEERGAQEPVWFPAGDRLAYRSGANSAIMTVPFDDRLGQASGRPQRITLDPVLRGFRISPDGHSFAHTMWAEGGGLCVRVVPANGGTARTVGEPANRIFLRDWSSDGRYIYYLARTEEAPQEGVNMRAPVAGGAPETVREPPAGPSAPKTPYSILRVSDSPAEAVPFEMRTYDGTPVARIALPEQTETEPYGRTSTDGRRLLVVVSGGVWTTRLVPVAGGTPRALGEARANEWPLGWSPDGTEVLFGTAVDGRLAIMSAPVPGGAAREVGPMPDRGPPIRQQWRNPITFTPDGRYLSYSRPNAEGADRTFVVRPVAGGDERVVTSSLFEHPGHGLDGRGGTSGIDESDFLYLERRGDQVELRATPPAGPARLIRSFTLDEAGGPKSVFGSRVAFIGEWDGSAVPIMVADGPNGAPKEIAAIPGVTAFDDVVWSPDGRWIAASAYVAAGPDDYTIKILLVGVTPDGEVSSPARLIDTPIIWAAWALNWLPDGSAVTLTGQSPPSGRYDVWLVPIQNGGRPVALTRDDPSSIGYNVLSPDGRYVAYRRWVGGGASLWLADLGDALREGGR
jgi:Tol biopolymer transport system component